MNKRTLSLILSITIYITSCTDAFGEGLIPNNGVVTATPMLITSTNQTVPSVESPIDAFADGLKPNSGVVTATPISTAMPTPIPETVRLEGVTEYVQDFPYKVIPLNNCAGNTDVEKVITETYTHEVINETKERLGIEIPMFVWLKIVADIENHYGVTTTTQETDSTTLKAQAGEYIEYTLVHKQTWESGTIISSNSGNQISASYRILKNEIIGVGNSEKKTCQ